ncbi:class I SAM-dependent methyltransferase [Rickettsiales bacterium LUAb2]
MEKTLQKQINDGFTKFYVQREYKYLYPTEYVVRIFLGQYPKLNLKSHLKKGDRVLDSGCGEGRNLFLLCNLEYDVYGTEITQEIVDHTRKTLAKFGYSPKLNIGRNNNLPYDDNFFDCILANHSSYYVDENCVFDDNLKSFNRVLKKDGFLVAALIMPSSFIVKDSIPLQNGLMVAAHDTYGLPKGYTVQTFSSEEEVIKALDPYFYNIVIAEAKDDFFGIRQDAYWVVAQKK